MTTLHLLPSTGHQTAATLKQNALLLFDETQSLRRALQSLAMGWQGGGQEQFTAQANTLLRNLQTQADALQILAGRLEREVTEWEQTDQRGAAAFRGINPHAGNPAFPGVPITGGGSDVPLLSQPILPLFTAVSLAPLLSGIPVWLKSLLDKIFPPPEIVSPIPEDSGVKPGALADLIRKKFDSQKAQTASSSAETKPSEGYAVSEIPPKAQGDLYGGAACLPTSISMALDYFHARNPANAAASPSDLIKMLDPGDGTSGGGVGLDRMNDDLAELGYQSSTRRGSMDDLSNALKSGPVIVNTGVTLTSGPRDILPGGSTNHSILVKAIDAQSVIVNDPWSGTEKSFSREVFEKMWAGGANYMTVIQPQAAP